MPYSSRMSTLIQILTCSTRPGRVGPKITHWLAGEARRLAIADIEVVDLADFALPVFDEPKHPRLQQYEREHTKQWSQTVARADGFVFVTPEYNYGPPPSLVNAMNYLNREWHYKPVAFASYGGISGGVRAVEAIKQLATTLRMVPVLEAVVAPMVAAQITADGFQASQVQVDAVRPMLAEVDRLARALKPLRAG
jgi:NAD(P)H-dependent FMN reductase